MSATQGSPRKWPPARICTDCGAVVGRGTEDYPDNHWEWCSLYPQAVQPAPGESAIHSVTRDMIILCGAEYGRSTFSSHKVTCPDCRAAIAALWSERAHERLGDPR